MIRCWPRSPTVPILEPGVASSGLRSLGDLMSVSMVQVTLIRPGATLYDEQNRVQGILDIPLSDRGRAEAARLAESLAATQDSAPLSALYCGPGESVIRTAEIVGKALGLRPDGSMSCETSIKVSGRVCRSRRSSGATPSCSASGSRIHEPSARRRARPSPTPSIGSRRHSSPWSAGTRTAMPSVWLSVNLSPA